MGAGLGQRSPQPQGLHQPRLLGPSRHIARLCRAALHPPARGRGAAGGHHARQYQARSGAGRPRWATGSARTTRGRATCAETIEAVVHYAFRSLDLSRIEAACLPENAASRGVLEKSGFKYEGVAQSYLQINGRLAQSRALRQSPLGPARANGMSVRAPARSAGATGGPEKPAFSVREISRFPFRFSWRKTAPII